MTLLVYWAAERYAMIMASGIVAGRGQNLAGLWRELSDGWGLVTTSFLPLVVLVVGDLFIADLPVAVLAALACSTALLFLAGLRMVAGGRLSLVKRLVSVTAAGAFGLVLIALKVALH